MAAERLSIVQTTDFAEQCATEARAWAASSQESRTEAELDAFEQGVKWGFGDAIRVLRLHGYEFNLG